MNSKKTGNHGNTDNLAWDTISWWFMLIVAVLAIPALGYAIVTVTGITGIMGILVFIVACWSSTYFGMHLMKHPSMREKKDITKVD
jgi:lipopolysaccharide export LptBFGC system permease protein LptF